MNHLIILQTYRRPEQNANRRTLWEGKGWLWEILVVPRYLYFLSLDSSSLYSP